MLLRQGPGQFINRADPRWRGRITWFPFFTGTRGSFGDVPGTFANATGSGFIGDALAGNAFNVPASTSSASALSVSDLGLNGSGQPWTIITRYRHRLQNNTFVPLFALGDPSGTNYIELLLFDPGSNFYGNLYLTSWTVNCVTSPVPSGGGGGDRLVRVAATYNGSTATVYWRALDTGANSWSSGSASFSATLTLANNHPLTLNGRPGGGTGAQQSTLAYLGVLGGTCWSVEEVNAYLADPTPLWTPQPFVWVPTSASGDQTITGALFSDGDTFPAHTITPGAVSITGAPFTDSDTFPAGTVTLGSGPQTITGALYSDADTFPAGTVSPGAVSIAGGLFTDADTFPGGTVSLATAQTITGALFTDADTFGEGSLGDIIGRSGRFLRGRYRVVGDPEPDGPITHDVRDIPAPTDLAAMQAELASLRREVREAKSKAEAAILREEIKTLRALIRRLEDEEDEIAALVLALA